MDTCDVLIVGGGPAGSSCAWSLRHTGLDIVIVDAATFPRDKVCAGWITPHVIEDLEIDVDCYRATRVFQPITGFRIGMLGEDATCDIHYRHPVSFAVRRCEFDQYLLMRSGARLVCGARVDRIRRRRSRWVVGDTFETPLLVGAGGHWCPVARMLNPAPRRDALIAAQEFECLLEGENARRCRVERGIVEMFFCHDLSGYAWCVRKGDYLNVGVGSYGGRPIPSAGSQFVEFLIRTKRIPAGLDYRWRGHAYATHSQPRLTDDGVLLVGDAAAVADPRSGEGIRQAIESGLLAGSCIASAAREYTATRLGGYAATARQRFGAGAHMSHTIRAQVLNAISGIVAPRLLRLPWFVRRVLLDRWFLHTADSPLNRWGVAPTGHEAR